MREEIIGIITSAKDLKRKGFSDFEIAKYVHIELGKLIIYDNNYSVRNVGFDIAQEFEGNISEDSLKRQIRLLNSNTNIENKEQICKGMAEIYASILNEIGVSAKVVGAKSKEEVDGEKRNDGTTIIVPEMYKCSFDNNMNIKTEENEHEENGNPSHWYCTVQTEKGEYIQDYLTEMALLRIKIGEANMQESQLAGFHLKEEHKDRVLASKININESFKNELYIEYQNYCKNNNKSNRAFDFVFEKLNNYISNFGFEETKDFIMLIGQCLPEEEIIKKPEIINIVKEDEQNCEIVCIYQYNGKNYLARSGIKNFGNPIGEITPENIEKILKDGFEPRKLSDAKKIRDMKKNKKISMKATISNAISQEITLADVQENDIEEKKTKEKQQAETDKSYENGV